MLGCPTRRLGIDSGNVMNATVSQLTADETKRLEKLFKHLKTAVGCSDVKLDSLALISLWLFELNLLFVNVISTVTKPGFLRDVCLSLCVCVCL